MNWDTKAHLRNFDTSFEGLPSRRYRGMKERTHGCRRNRRHTSAMNKPICSKQEFIDWSVTDPDYVRLYREWKDSGFKPDLSPSIHRLDESLGYELGNMKWLTRLEHIGR